MDVEISTEGWNSGLIEVFHQVATGFEFVSNENGVMTVKYTQMDGTVKTLYAKHGIDGFTKETEYAIKYIRLYDIVIDALIKAHQGQYGGTRGYGSAGNSMAGKFLFSILDSITTSLGVTPMEDLIYNRTDRESGESAKNYKYGLYPPGWDSIISMVQKTAYTISLAFISFAILKVIFMLNVDAMNIDARINIKRDIMNIIIALGGILLFKVVYVALISLNYILVGFIYNVLCQSQVDILGTFLGNVNGLVPGTIGDTLVGFISLGVKAYINVMYIARSVTIALLISLYPIFMVSAAFSGFEKIKDFIMELVSNIFLQTFHAVVFMFITLASAKSGTSDVFTNTVLLTLMIPMSGAYRELILGRKSGTLQGAAMVGMQASNQVKSMAKTGTLMAAGAVGATVGGAMLFKADVLDGKGKLKDIKQNSSLGKTSGGVGNLKQGGMDVNSNDVSENSANASVDNMGSDPITNDSLFNEGTKSSEDVKKEMVNSVKANSLRNIVGIAQAIKSGNAQGVYQFLNTVQSGNDNLKNLSDIRKQKLDFENKQLYARSQVPQVGDSGVVVGSDVKSTISEKEFEDCGFTNLKNVDGNADVLSSTVDINNNSLPSNIPREFGLIKERTRDYDNWVSGFKNEPSDVEKEKWVKENAPEFNSVPKKVNDNKYNVEMNFVNANIRLNMKDK